MRVAILGSGSAGNSLVVESGGRRILIDAGFSCREIERRCERRGIDAASLQDTPLVPTHESLFDGTLEGVRHEELPVAAVQFHPEAGPGPHEAETFFDRFTRSVSGELRLEPTTRQDGAR